MGPRSFLELGLPWSSTFPGVRPFSWSSSQTGVWLFLEFATPIHSRYIIDKVELQQNGRTPVGEFMWPTFFCVQVPLPLPLRVTSRYNALLLKNAFSFPTFMPNSRKGRSQ